MASARLLLWFLLSAAVAAGPVQARLGETVGDLKKRFGRPELESRGNNVFWLFEGDDGQLLYTVTLNGAGRSIAEGLKPHKRARFHENDAHVFITSQLEPWENSKTLRTLKPGEHYRFAGQNFVVEPSETVMVDEPNGVLLIWNKSVNPSVMVIAPELLQRSR